MRQAVNQASNAANTAATTAGQYNSTASGIGANLIPFATRMMTNPTGYSQRDIGAQLTQGLAGAGGATAGLTGAADKMATTTRNPMGFSSALDAAARSRDKAAAGVGEDVAARNAGVKLQQQNSAADMLGGLYKTAGSLGAENSGQISQDVNSEVNASKTGWLQNAEGLVDTGADVFSKLFPKGIPGMGGGGGGGGN